MPNFFDLPLELRRLVYNELEATEVLYSKNRFRIFDFPVWDSRGAGVCILDDFVNTIGMKNARHLRHIGIRFPIPRESQLNPHLGARLFWGPYRPSPNMAISSSDTKVLNIIRDKCTNIKTLEISLHSTYDVENELSRFHKRGPTNVSEFLARVDKRFKEIKSLKEVIVHAYDVSWDDDMDVRAKMSGFGWSMNCRSK